MHEDEPTGADMKDASTASDTSKDKDKDKPQTEREVDEAPFTIAALRGFRFDSLHETLYWMLVACSGGLFALFWFVPSRNVSVLMPSFKGRSALFDLHS